jgi:cytochrome c
MVATTATIERGFEIMTLKTVAAAFSLLVIAGGVAHADGDAAAGQKVFAKCKACHNADSDKNKIGPSLMGVVGRHAGTYDGFNYSAAMKGEDITWTPENLDKYLADPKGFVPGNKMAFIGLKKEDDRKNVIAYLEQEAKAK